MKKLSSRFHLAFGLTSILVTLLLLAAFVGLLPDRDAALRAGRTALAETVAVASSVLLNEDSDAALEQMLGFVLARNPQLKTVEVRQADGAVLLRVGAPPAAADQGAESTETLVRVPLLRDGALWGGAELHFAPLHGEGWVAWVGSAPLLIAALALASFTCFAVYLRRMLRHLDPARVIPARVRTAFDTLAEGLMVLDPQDRIVLANSALVAVVGGDADALIGRDAADLGWRFAPDAPAGMDSWPALFGGGQARRNVLVYLVDVRGRRRSFMVNGSPVPGAGGKPAGMLVSLDDVTALEEQEIQLRLARDAAETANRAKSEFLANMSHEIRTPMNAILGFAELLKRGWHRDAKDAERHLGTIVSSGRHLLALINDILDLSKVEAGRLQVESVPCAVHEVVHEVVAIMRARADEKGVGLAVEFAQALPAKVHTDPARVRQIVTNLVGNALKFTHRGRVTVRLRLARGDDAAPLVAIDVGDSGIGIDADKFESIFEPFVQAEASTTRQYGGTGLGLAISRRFARALGGDITVASRLGEGSTFSVTIAAGALDGVAWLEPQALAGAAQAPRPEAAQAPRPEAAPCWQFAPACVLVVDDAKENRELLHVVLEGAGLSVVEASNGAEALDAVATHDPQLVLMDVQMPVLDGYAATRELRRRGFTRTVVALTAHAMKGAEQQARDAGFDAHLTKPLDVDALLAELGRRLDGRVVAADDPARSALREAPGAQPMAPGSTVPPQATAPGDRGPIASRLAEHPRLRRVVRQFALALPDRIAAMQEALRAGRFDELAALAHWLKGSGGSVGYDCFFEPARRLEAAARSERRADGEDELQVLRELGSRLSIPDEPGSDLASAECSAEPA